MYALRIQFAVAEINLQFKEWLEAKRIYDNIGSWSSDEKISFSDGFNRQVSFHPNDVVFTLLQDLNQEVDASVALAEFQKKANMRVGMAQQGGIAMPVFNARRQ